MHTHNSEMSERNGLIQSCEFCIINQHDEAVYDVNCTTRISTFCSDCRLHAALPACQNAPQTPQKTPEVAKEGFSSWFRPPSLSASVQMPLDHKGHSCGESTGRRLHPTGVWFQLICLFTTTVAAELLLHISIPCCSYQVWLCWDLASYALPQRSLIWPHGSF